MTDSAIPLLRFVRTIAAVVFFASESPLPDTVDEISITGFIPDEEQISKFYGALKPLSKLLIKNIPDRESGQALSVDLKILGFVDIMAAKGSIFFI